MSNWWENWKGNQPPSWQQPRIEALLLELEPLGFQDSDKFIAIRDREIQACYDNGVSDVSIKNNFTHIRKAIALYFQGKLTDNNSYLHPTRKIREHISLLTLDIPQDIKDQNHRLHQQALDCKHTNVAYLDDPDAIVAKGRELLEKAIASYEQGEFCNFRDLGAALALLAGLRPIEVLKTAILEPKSKYIIIMAGGQAKTRGENRVYDMPTLIEADRVLQGYQILRDIFDATHLNEAQMKRWINGVRDKVIEEFSDLIPTLRRLSGEKTVNTQRLRSVYDAICVFYYCPPQVKDFVYVKAINGHKAQGKADAAMHYLDYAIADEVIAKYGGRRQGIKLNDPEVEIIKTFSQQPSQTSQTMKKTSRKFSLAVKRETKQAFQEYQDKKGLTTQDEALQLLLAHPESSQPKEETLKQPSLLDLKPSEMAELLGLEEETTEKIEEALRLSELEWKEFLKTAIEKEIKFRIGLTQRFEGEDFSTMPLSKLKKVRHPEASAERIRRAFLAIKNYNSNIATEKKERWYINANSIHGLVGGRFATVSPWCEAHADEIESHNQMYELTVGDNRKSIKISEVIPLPEYPED